MRLFVLSLLPVALFACTDASTPDEPGSGSSSATSTVIDEDVCDWDSAGDRGIVATDAVVTPHGIAVACEGPNETAHSLLLVDPATHAKRDVYGIQAIAIEAIALADPDTLLLEGYRELYVVDLAAATPRPERILVYPGTGHRMFDPQVVGDAVEVIHELCDDAGTCASTLESVLLHGGPDQQPALLGQLPPNAYRMLYATPDSYVMGWTDNDLTIGRFARASQPVAVTPMLDDWSQGYTPESGLFGAVGGRALWQESPGQAVELTGNNLSAIDAFACPLSDQARIIDLDVVQVPWTPTDPCQDIVAMDVVNRSVRRAPLDLQFEEVYRVIGIVGHTAWVTETDVDRTRVITSTLVETAASQQD